MASTAFADAERAHRFLRYVVERKLEGRDSEIGIWQLESAPDRPHQRGIRSGSERASALFAVRARRRTDRAAV
jgi:hypothetical protein